MAGGFLTAVGGKLLEKATDLLFNQEDDEYDEYDHAPEDPKVIFEKACKEANEYLTKMVNEFGLPGDEISATYQQLRKKEVTISTHGRHSCGKSTLLNALLDESLLPTCLENNTGVRVTIKHSDFVHQGMCPDLTPCEKCPKLTTTRTGAPQVVRGARDVRDALNEINNVSRKLSSEVDEVDSQATECILTTNLPVLSGVERGWELSILDNPGYGEANQEDMMQETETTMKTSSALLYVMDVGQLQDKEDAQRLQQLHTADEGIFADSNRLTVAVTQYDKVFSESREWSKEEIQRRVCAFIERQTGSRVPPEVVIPVCGKWAFDARQLKQKQCQDDKALLRRVRSALVLCPDAPGGQESTSMEELPEVMADRLLSVTGIEVLENRIHMMASVCVRTWVSSLSQKYHNYLEMVVKRLDSSIQETAAELTHFTESHRTVVRQYNELKDSARNLEDGTVLGRLRECCEQDILVAKESAKRVLEDFHRQCRSEIEAKKRDFGPKEYEDRITALLTEEFSVKLCATVFDASRGFTHGWNVRNAAIMKMKRGIRRMEQAAERFLALSSERSTDDVDYSEEELSAPEEIDNFEGVFKGKKLTFKNFKNKVKIPNLDLSWGQWFSNGFWWGISRLRISNPPIYTYSSAECVTETMEQTDTYVRDTLNSYLQGLELSVAESFFSNYRKITKTHLSSFEERYKGRVEQQKKKGDEHLRELTSRLQLQGEEKTRVQQFQWRLKHASEEYNHVLCKNEFEHVYM